MAAASVLLVGLQVPWGALAGVGHTLSRARTPRLAQLERLLPAGAYEVRVSGPPITHVGPVGWPVPGRTRVTSGFGWRRHPILGGARFHNGIDIAMAEGTPVRAAAPGTVHRAGEDPLNGRYVVLLHGRGLRTAYCHLSAVQAERGAPVQAGEVIGRSGQTGRASGPHLHFGTWVRGRAVDPLRLVASTP
jgi:murein DD-endopeptidase MepM/ murein hydrolase activator NlpD